MSERGVAPAAPLHTDDDMSTVIRSRSGTRAILGGLFPF
jgi:hypothetical protein